MVHQSWMLLVVVGALLVHIVSGATTCIQCNSNDDKDCISGNVPAKNCPAEDSCFSFSDGNSIFRGCLSSLSQNTTLQGKCNSATDYSCITCGTDSCNNAKWLTCHVCSATDDNCAAEQFDQAKATPCKTYTQDDKCYSKVDGNTVTRGCLSDLGNANDCANQKYCESCEGDACNKESSDTLKTFTKCLRCTSTDAKCIDGSLEAVDCDKRVDSCYTRYIDSKLERDCLSKLSGEQSKCTDSGYTTCVSCENSACNVLPWLQCHQCKELDDPTCTGTQAENKAKFCQHHKEGNRCYERLEQTKVVRGCETDLGPETEDPCKDNKECRYCGTNACNKEAAETLKSTDRCLQCNTKGAPNENCLLGTESSLPCATPSSEKCFSKVDDGGVLFRGCYGDLKAEEVNACKDKKCNICEKEGCNNKTFPTDRLRCYQCNSKTDKNCTDALTGEPKAAYCKIYKDDDQCYSRIVNEVFERGCQSDLSKDACDGLNDKECKLCTGENCNSISQEKLKNSAGTNAVSLVFVVLCSLVSVRISSR